MDIIQDNYTYAMRVVNLFKIETIFRAQWQKKLKKIIAHNGSRLGEVAEHKTSLELQILKIR